jgi:hypothetical protein
MFMGEAGGMGRSFQEWDSQAFRQVDNPYARGAGYVLDILTKLGFFVGDTDVSLGSFGVRVTNNNGRIEPEWGNLERIVHSYGDPVTRTPQMPQGHPNTREMLMGGDGSKYVA